MARSKNRNKNRTAHKRERGWIYCLSNPSFSDKVKIGFTTNRVEERMAQLDDTSTPTPFNLAGKWKSRDVTGDEKFIHRKLAKYRTRTNREFFDLPAKEAVAKISSLLGKTPSRRTDNGLTYGFAVIFILAMSIFFYLNAS